MRDKRPLMESPPACATMFGTRVLATTREAAAAAVVRRAVAGEGGYVCLCNVHVLVSARTDASLRHALDGASMVFADGAPVAWLQRQRGVVAQRIAGPDLLEDVIAAGQAHGLRHLFFGSTRCVVDRLTVALSERYPDAQIAGAVAPPVANPAELGGHWLDEIRAGRPDVVWCSLGAPKQELWMQAHASSLAPALVLGVGAAFEFAAATRRRAPAWMQTAGLEWLHRWVAEPRRLTGRYVRTNSQFLVLAAADLLSARVARPVTQRGKTGGSARSLPGLSDRFDAEA